MISYQYEADFKLGNDDKYTDWINNIVRGEKWGMGDLDYVFCTDDYLYSLNEKYLGHKTYTDIITFDYSEGNTVSGEIYISVDRVKENAMRYNVDFDIELQRVMAHGLLHLMGFNDKTDKEKELMRDKESEKINLFHVKQ
ncbi:rRNA maturation RNase YbeY [Eudoraea adriatica]|uniref:rRNA maturation RNase YbeY n=1 Tax=Eudoraea adriatica TaxID=446681 RepID=UPI000368BC05|nr:rRNA maturation RNase YbeY [Eudoraea adriatica]